MPTFSLVICSTVKAVTGDCLFACDGEVLSYHFGSKIAHREACIPDMAEEGGTVQVERACQRADIFHNEKVI
jgi:hypothetical protein